MKFANEACGEGFRYSSVLQTCVPDTASGTDISSPISTGGGGAWSSENLKDYGSILADLIGAFRRRPDTPDTIIYQPAPAQKNNSGIWIAVAVGVVVLYFLLKK
ncbi:MAG: hypothetical protein HRU41_39215 [Saprospiraceae bacterium]|nr:hypothetical protein [Saprospiraceae bacterium]